MRAARKAGEMVKEMEEQEQRVKGRPQKASHTARLSDLEISWTQSSRWRQIANVPEEVFEEYIQERKDSALDQLTTSGLMTQANYANKREEGERIRNQPPPLPEGPFRVIVADPPWPYALRRPTNDSRGSAPYAVMSFGRD